MSQAVELEKTWKEESSPLIMKEMDANHAAADTEQLQRDYTRRFKVPWPQVQSAIDEGYVYPGWHLIDYLRATDQGNSNLGLRCKTCGVMFYDYEVFNAHLEKEAHESGVRKPFEYVDVWGVQGAAKSAFTFQMQAMLYQDWQTALDRMLIERDMLIDAYEEVPEPGQRIPSGCLDDLNTIISKQEWFVDKDFYILFHKFLNTIRTKFGTILSTLPNVEFTPEMLGDIVTFEVIIYPNSTYKVERYVWDIHPYFPVKAKFSKIVIEQPSKPFDIYRTPAQWWQKYQVRRLEVANKLFAEMKDYMEKSKGGLAKEGAARMMKQGLRGASGQVIGNRVRAEGYKVPQEALQAIVKMTKEEIAKRALDEAMPLP